MSRQPVRLLGAGDIRGLADELHVRPSKSLGQNFVIDPNTVRRIVRLASVTSGSDVLEVGPGLGSLTLALLDVGANVTAVEIDARLAERLPRTARQQGLDDTARLTVLHADAMHRLTLPCPPQILVANLPYNVAVPVLLNLLESWPSLATALVMVQREVGQRLAASPGSRTYGVPSVKAQWFADVRLAGEVPRSVFWPVPNVDSILVRLTRRAEPVCLAGRAEAFVVVDAAFAQRRKSLRAALRAVFGTRSDEVLALAGIDSGLRGEQLTAAEFARIADAGAAIRVSAP